MCSPEKVSQIVRLFSYHFCLFYSTSPEEFMTRLKEHHKQKSSVKQQSGQERNFSPLLNPKEEVSKFPSPSFTKEKVKETFSSCS
jgi:hypothetical protein